MWDSAKWVIGFLILLFIFRAASVVGDGGGVKDILIQIWEGDQVEVVTPSTDSAVVESDSTKL